MAIQVLSTGVNVATGVASAAGAIPNNSAGTLAKFVRFAVTQATDIRLGTGTPVALATDMMVLPGESPILATLGLTNFAVLQVAAAGVVQVSPVENPF